jgi:nitrite reductase (NAD(P)H)
MSDPVPILTQGVEPSSGQEHSPASSPPRNSTWGDKNAESAKRNAHEPDAPKIPGKVQDGTAQKEEQKEPERKRIVVVGLGMVGISFM